MRELSTPPDLTVPVPTRAPVVLLVDDSATVVESVQRLLADEPDIEFHSCRDSHAALAAATELFPTVILQDLAMPGLDGLTLVHLYRQNRYTRDVPIIVLSATDKAHVKANAFAAGANDYMVKLPDRVELVARIRYHSKAYNSLLQRDAAYQALRDSQQRLEEQHRELQRLYSLDGLTGIANRRFFDETLEKEWRRAIRERCMLSVLLFDVDSFKGFNDTYGHLAGDACLRRIAQGVQEVLRRPGDMVARYGGEEFVTILPGTDAAGATSRAEVMRELVEGLQIAHQGSNAGPYVTISVGCATIMPIPGFAPGILIAAADKALYQAKSDGRNRVRHAADAGRAHARTLA